MAHHIFFGAFENDFCISHEEIEQFKSDLKDGENSTIWAGEYPEVLHWSDMFMGERSAVTMEMTTTGKPVIYLENCPEIYNEFGKDVINSYYYATNADEALKYLEQIKQGIDPKQNEREKVFEKYFAPYWDGKCGERIKEDLISSTFQFQDPIVKIFLIYIRNFLSEFFEFIFSIKLKSRVNAKHLVITILGVSLKIKLCKLDEDDYEI